MQHMWMWAAMGLGSTVLAGMALEPAELELDHQISSRLVTPHITWAKPSAAGKARVLFFVNGRGTRAREVVELDQRFDLDAQMVFWGRIIDSSRDDWHGGETGIQRMASLLEQPWDAFVFFDTPLNKVPIQQQYVLIKAVTEGTGLVLIHTEDSRVFKAKNRVANLPDFLADVAGAKVFRVGAGRGVHVPAAPTIAYHPGWEVSYDEWDMRLGKAILWAAHKVPPTSLSLSFDAGAIRRRDLPRNAATLQWRNAAPGTVAEVILRSYDGRTLARESRPLSPGGAGSLQLSLPRVRAGRYAFDVVAQGENQDVVGFASASVEVSTARRVERVDLDRDWAEIGELFSGRVTVSGKLGGKDMLRIGVFDTRGRELVRHVSKPEAGGTPFTFKVRPWFPMLVVFRATLIDDTGEVASAWRFAHVVKRRQGRFNFVMWDVPRGNLAPYAEASLARTGVSVQLGGGFPPPYVAANHIAWIPYTTHIRAKRDAKGIMEPVCWNNDAAFQKVVDGIAQKWIPARQHGVFVYSLGDEIAVRGSCLSPDCLEAYRRYLQREYGTIAALNASWGTSYAGFDQVRLDPPDDNDGTHALHAGNFPRWYDRQAFQSYNFCMLCERFGKAFRRIDPRSRCGFEGAGTFDHADDLDGFVRHNTFWSPYPGTADEVLRSIAPRDFPHANWMGYTKDADSLLEKYWRMVTRGCDAVWWWRWEVVGRFHGWLAPNLDPYPAVREVLRDTRVVRNGLGDVLLHAEMETDDIGILFSLPSAYAAKIQTSPSFGSYESNHTACHRIIRNLGCNFRYFTDRQMRRGEVDLNTFKIIFLPMIQAVGPREAAMLRDYVRRGGRLVADIRPAVYDGHVKALVSGSLDDVFGIRRVGDRQEAKRTEARLKASLFGDTSATAPALNQVRVDAGVTAGEAEAGGEAGGVPIFLRHRFGRGQALLLNVALSSLPRADNADAPDRLRAWWRRMFAEAGVLPAWELTDGRGNFPAQVEVTRWHLGRIEIVSFFRHGGSTETLTWKLSQPSFVYDLKQGKALGKHPHISLAPPAHRAEFFVLAPQALEPITMDAMQTVGGGDRLKLRFSSPSGQTLRAVTLRIELPDGTAADWVDPVVLIPGAGAEVVVPVAYNDPPGTWVIAATDLFTGKTTKLPFQVNAHP